MEIRTYEIIYKLIEDIEAAMVGMLAPTFEEVVTGEAEVREVFRVPRVGAIAGCYVRNGVITRGSKVRFLREGVVIWKGAITSLRRFKDDVREVQAGLRVRHRALRLPGPAGRATSSRPSRSGRSPAPDARRRPRWAGDGRSSWTDRRTSGTSSDNRGAAPYARSLGSTRSSARCWPRSSSGWPTPTSACGCSRSPGRLDPDLRQAMVYLSSLTEEAAEALEERRVQVQARSARQIRLKRTPQLSFAPDPAVVAGSGSRTCCAGSTVDDDRDDSGDAAPVSPPAVDQVNGLVVVDKEAGWTSHDVVARCRRIFGQKRVGHAGTLDPDATGVLVVGLGRATRLLRFLTALPKAYEAEVVLGTATSTLDASGEVDRAAATWRT